MTVLLLGDIAKQRNRVELHLFLAATLEGFILEILAVRATDIYHYSNDYFLSIGAPPNQFPVFGGMWGALAVCGFRIATVVHGTWREGQLRWLAAYSTRFTY